MKKESVINIRIDKEKKKEVEDIFESMGLNISTAVNMFFSQCIRVNGIPFEIKASVDTKSIEIKNCEGNEKIKINKKVYKCKIIDDVYYVYVGDKKFAICIEDVSSRELCIYPNMWKTENRYVFPSVVHHEEGFITDYVSKGFKRLQSVSNETIKILILKNLDNLTIHANGRKKEILLPECSVNDIHIMLEKDFDNYIKYCDDYKEFISYKI